MREGGDADAEQPQRAGPPDTPEGREQEPRAEPATGRLVDDADVRRMLAFQAGDAGAFDELFARWAGPLLRYLDRMMRDRAAAEELVQEAFLRVHRSRDRYAPDARFSTWLFRIATNLALNELRRPERRRRARPSPEGEPPDPPDEAPGLDDVVHARRLGASVSAALDALPERQRQALWLAAVEGMPYAEVARVLETSAASVKALVHRARSQLAGRLQEERGDA